VGAGPNIAAKNGGGDTRREIHNTGQQGGSTSCGKEGRVENPREVLLNTEGRKKQPAKRRGKIEFLLRVPHV